jgi:putative sigma-54 modulation protein
MQIIKQENQGWSMSESQEYNISMYCKHITATESIKEYVAEKLSKIERITPGIIDVHVKLEVHKHEQSATITMRFSHFQVTAHSVTGDLYTSIDEAIRRLVRKLRKWKTKIQGHHAEKLASIEIPVSIFEKEKSETDEINDAIEEANSDEFEAILAVPKIAKSKLRSMKKLTLEEAMLKMDLSDDNFLIYRSHDDQKLKVLYRRRDKSYGLLQPE